MQHTTKLGAAVAVAALALAMVASTASAEVKDAIWSSNNLTVTGSVTFKKAGGTPSTCTFNAHAGAQKGGSEFILYNDEFIHGASCTYSSWFRWELRGKAKYDTSTGTYFLEGVDQSNYYATSPWGSSPLWYVGGYTVKPPYANGSGSNPSTITFSEVTVGKTQTLLQPVTASGELKVVDTETKQAVTLS